MKTKVKTLERLIKARKFDWVNPDITSANFPPQEIRKDFKLFHFDRVMTSKEAIAEMKKEGYEPANIYELLNWKDWNGKDFVVALGSGWRDPHGRRRVPYLGLWLGERKLNLSWLDDRWFARCRFLAVRALPSDSLETSTSTLTLEEAINKVKSAGYEVYKKL